jgi:hypothetical protein
MDSSSRKVILCSVLKSHHRWSHALGAALGSNDLATIRSWDRTPLVEAVATATEGSARLSFHAMMLVAHSGGLAENNIGTTTMETLVASQFKIPPIWHVSEVNALK